MPASGGLNVTRTPQSDGFFQPAEWAPQAACWSAWPSHGDLWLDALGDAQAEFATLCRTIARGGTRLELLCPEEQEATARAALEGLDVRFHRVPFGDIWLRDTAPIFLLDATGRLASAQFRFNGWGGKYVLEHDDLISQRVAALAGVPTYAFDWILEGGSVEVDGEGTCLTSRQCLLNPNRNSGMSEAQIEAGLRESLGVEKVLWVDEGLLNDHTDGHVDTIARFVAPGVVVCMEASGSDDPNRRVMDAIAQQLAAMTDARGRKLEVVRVPSPGLVQDEDGRVMPASHVNFYIGNEAVAVPTYGTAFDDAVVKALEPLFPGREVVGSSALAILGGGGAFHCITQQVPRSAAGGSR
jgi:agmatine deiminase